MKHVHFMPKLAFGISLGSASYYKEMTRYSISHLIWASVFSRSWDQSINQTIFVSKSRIIEDENTRICRYSNVEMYINTYPVKNSQQFNSWRRIGLYRWWSAFIFQAPVCINMAYVPFGVFIWTIYQRYRPIHHHEINSRELPYDTLSPHQMRSYTFIIVENSTLSCADVTTYRQMHRVSFICLYVYIIFGLIESHRWSNFTLTWHPNNAHGHIVVINTCAIYLKYDDTVKRDGSQWEWGKAMELLR